MVVDPGLTRKDSCLRRTDRDLAGNAIDCCLQVLRLSAVIRAMQPNQPKSGVGVVVWFDLRATAWLRVSHTVP